MMQFIVLGYVPGTEVQLTFETIATFFCVAGFVYLCWSLYMDEMRLRQEIIEAVNKRSL